MTSGWASRNALDAREWVSSLAAGPQRDRTAAAFASAVADSLPREAWSWVTSITDDAVRLRAATDTLNVVGARDPNSARQWIEAGPFSAAEKAQLYATVARATPK